VETELLEADNAAHLRRGAALLCAGRIVGIPTETVYGLGARADDPDAVERLYRIKGRQRDKPFSLLVASEAQAREFASPGPLACRLARRFWPGPLTLVVPDGRGGHVGLRCPDHPAARELVRLAAVPIAAPSANLSDEAPATTARQVLAVFGGSIAVVLDGGPCRVGVASTVVLVAGGEMKVLREGAVSVAQMRQALAGEE